MGCGNTESLLPLLTHKHRVLTSIYVPVPCIVINYLTVPLDGIFYFYSARPLIKYLEHSKNLENVLGNDTKAVCNSFYIVYTSQLPVLTKQKITVLHTHKAISSGPCSSAKLLPQ